MPQGTNPYQRTLVKQSITPAAARTTTTTGSAVDTTVAGGFDSALLIVSTGVITDGTHTFKITESETSGGSYTDAAAGSYDGPAIALDTTAAHDNTVFVQGFKINAAKPFVKVVCTVTGGPATGGIYSAVVALLDADQQPVTQVGT